MVSRSTVALEAKKGTSVIRARITVCAAVQCRGVFLVEQDERVGGSGC